MELIKRLVSAIFIITLVAGCATAPSHTKKEAQKPYKIEGKWYSPADTPYGYEEVGIASWYGKDFHGRKTSSGDTYDMHAMTAAHKTLPMGTYVRVIRLDSGREAVVRINDRGPFVRDRIIDLSYKAASDLGVTESGNVRVKVVALGDAVGDRLVKRDYQRGDFSVQVGSFTVRDNALKLKDSLSKRYSNTSISAFDRGKTVFYRVRVGRLASLKEAERLRSRLEAEGVGSPFVVAD